jgi:hypothetical protein
MKQISLGTTGFELFSKRKRKRFFLEEFNLGMQLLAAPCSRKKTEEAMCVLRQAAMRIGNRKALDKLCPWGNHLSDKAEHMKANVRTRCGHPYGAIKCQCFTTRAMARVVQPLLS